MNFLVFSILSFLQELYQKIGIYVDDCNRIFRLAGYIWMTLNHPFRFLLCCVGLNICFNRKQFSLAMKLCPFGYCIGGLYVLLLTVFLRLLWSVVTTGKDVALTHPEIVANKFTNNFKYVSSFLVASRCVGN